MSNHIVVVGGGFAGLACARKLEKTLSSKQGHITLISNHEYLFNNLGAPRALISPEFAQESFVPIAKLFKHAENKVIFGLVESVLVDKVILADKQEVMYDYLVIATGASYDPFKPEMSNKEAGLILFKKNSDLVEKAEKIIIVGGGPTGIEMAAEIKTKYTNKQVTLIHSGAALTKSNTSESFKARLKTKLEDLGVTVVLGEKVDTSQFPDQNVIEGGHTLSTQNQISIASDLTFFSIGRRTFHSGLVSSLSSELLNENKEIKVKSTLQIQDDRFPRVFCLGDVACTGAPKSYLNADNQSTLVAKNVKNLIRNKSNLANYKFSEDKMLFVALGSVGVAEIPGMPAFATDFMAKSFKTKYLFNDKFYKELNQPFKK